MVNNNKWGFGVIVSLIVISLGIFLLVFYKNVAIEPQTVYTVYLDGRSIGNIVSKKSFEDYINVKEEVNNALIDTDTQIKELVTQTQMVVQENQALRKKQNQLIEALTQIEVKDDDTVHKEM